MATESPILIVPNTTSKLHVYETQSRTMDILYLASLFCKPFRLIYGCDKPTCLKVLLSIKSKLLVLKRLCLVDVQRQVEGRGLKGAYRIRNIERIGTGCPIQI